MHHASIEAGSTSHHAPSAPSTDRTLDCVRFGGDVYGSVDTTTALFTALMKTLQMSGTAFELGGKIVRAGRMPARTMVQRVDRMMPQLLAAGAETLETAAALRELAEMNDQVSWSAIH